jgi:hypothetical protein
MKIIFWCAVHKLNISKTDLAVFTGSTFTTVALLLVTNAGTATTVAFLFIRVFKLSQNRSFFDESIGFFPEPKDSEVIIGYKGFSAVEIFTKRSCKTISADTLAHDTHCMRSTSLWAGRQSRAVLATITLVTVTHALIANTMVVTIARTLHSNGVRAAGSRVARRAVAATKESTTVRTSSDLVLSFISMGWRLHIELLAQ